MSSTTGLSRQELIGLIKQYRGKNDALTDYSTKRLQMLLKFYEVSVAMMSASAADGIHDQDTESTPVKPETAHTGNCNASIKREHEDIGTGRGGQKRSKPKIIVFDG